MEKILRNRGELGAVDDVARLLVLPPIRCHERQLHREPGICGKPAYYERRNDYGHQVGFFCEAHTRAGDAAIGADVLIRRVSLVVEVSFAGVSVIPSMAQAEALYRLERGVEQAGGLLSLSSVTSVIGRFTPPPAVPKGKGRGLRG